jgi:hypothetical protein
MEASSGTPDVVVVLCDAASGIPVDNRTFAPFTSAPKKQFPPNLVVTLSGPRGTFSFTNVPPGEYRLVAQKWAGPYKGVFEVHGGVVQLFGTADNIRVPSAEAKKVVLRPPGDGILALDMRVPNSGTLVVLSTQPLSADPILGFSAPGTNFFSHTLGWNVMPYGRTTFVGLPQTKLHTWFFANDNSPGFTAEVYDVESGFLRAPAIPFVAGWSDGRKEPPPRLQELADRLKKLGRSPQAVLGVDETLPLRDQYERVALYRENPSHTVMLSNGETIPGGDLVALMLYEQLGRR